MKMLTADDPWFFITSVFNNYIINPEDAYCLITLYLRLCKKRIIKCSDRKNFKTFENRVLDAEEIVGHGQRASQMYYNKNLFNWEKDMDLFPKRHY